MQKVYADENCFGKWNEIVVLFLPQLQAFSERILQKAQIVTNLLKSCIEVVLIISLQLIERSLEEKENNLTNAAVALFCTNQTTNMHVEIAMAIRVSIQFKIKYSICTN